MSCVHSDRGALALYVAVMAMALMATLGLILSGGQKIEALREATNIADNAARAGAQHIDLATLSTGVQLNPSAAVAAANTYLIQTGHSGTATVNGATITVTVAISYNPLILPGGPVTVQATEAASAVVEVGP